MTERENYSFQIWPNKKIAIQKNQDIDKISVLPWHDLAPVSNKMAIQRQTGSEKNQIIGQEDKETASNMTGSGIFIKNLGVLD